MWHPFHTKRSGETTGARKPRERFRDLASESEMFLSGRYAEHLLAHGLPVPDWAWLNSLAHLPAHEVAEIAHREPSIPARWCKRGCDKAAADQLLNGQSAIRYLAGELLQRAGNQGRRIEDIQREILVDLELELAHDAEVVGVLPTGKLTPAQLIVKVLSTLDNPLNHHT